MPRARGIVNGSTRRLARPVRGQRLLYSDWKRSHALKYESVVTPDGMIRHIFGPILGRRHDATMWIRGSLLHVLCQYFMDVDG